MACQQYQMVPEYDSLEGLCQDETKVFNMFRYYSDEDTRYGGRQSQDFPTKYLMINPGLSRATDAMITLCNTCSRIAVGASMTIMTSVCRCSLV